jgi:Coenzyme PQQ synthesis protein D (PqqD)
MEEHMTETTMQSHPLLAASIRVPEHVVYRDFPSETVVLNLQTGRYHGLNSTAGELLAALEKGDTVDAAAHAIAKSHGVDVGTVRDDLCRLCKQLSERGLIAISVPEAGSTAPSWS